MCMSVYGSIAFYLPTPLQCGGKKLPGEKYLDKKCMVSYSCIVCL